MKRYSLLLLTVLVAISSAFAHPPKRKTPAKKRVSAVVFPVAGKKSAIRDKWGASRGGGIRRHKGIDIHARKGTPVVALSDGRIVERAVMPVGGKTLWLKSAQIGGTAYYAHLDKQLVREGQWVRKGQVIGTVGNTGNARTTPPHLHFGVSKGNKWVNPLPYVKGAPKVLLASAPAKKKAKKGHA
ncbi:MAG: M23 family metallopeptidase [Chitinophagaceae bacterium]|nr:MAG: M23 family metallopeptidase [Chitinophagaceae bacterium]